MANILYLYGGFTIPSSFICFYDLRRLYDAHLEQSNVVIGELRSVSSIASESQYSPSTKILGCRKNDPLMKEYSEYLDQLVSKDYTSDMDFTGEPSRWWMSKLNKPNQNCFGLEDNQMGDVDIRISPTSAGIYIPDQEILKRTKFQWFARLSPSQVLESNTLIGKYILAKSSGC
jgi:hypothetical protein